LIADIQQQNLKYTTNNMELTEERCLLASVADFSEKCRASQLQTITKLTISTVQNLTQFGAA